MRRTVLADDAYWFEGMLRNYKSHELFRTMRELFESHQVNAGSGQAGTKAAAGVVSNRRAATTKTA